MNIIEIHQLSKYYRRARGIEEISLNVPQGDIFGFIGPNGAGNSVVHIGFNLQEKRHTHVIYHLPLTIDHLPLTIALTSD